MLGGYSPRLIEPGRLTVAELLRQHGYHTTSSASGTSAWTGRCPGKPRFTTASRTVPTAGTSTYARPIANGPTAVGFDAFFGISASLDMLPYTFIEGDRVTAIAHGGQGFRGRDRPRVVATRARGGGLRGRATSCPRSTHGPSPTSGAGPTRRRPGRPFFLYLPLTAPHTPIVPRAHGRARAASTAYGDFVMQVDAAIGEVLEVARCTGPGRSDTWCSSPATTAARPQAKFPVLRANGHDPSAGLRGDKADIFEGGHHVPFLVRWPGRSSRAAGAISSSA